MKRFSALIISLLLLFALSVTALAEPAWYPYDPSSFQDYHAVDPPHVVDDADLFTPSEEAAIAAKIDELLSLYPDYDFVIFTDDTTYGLDASTYADDFYVYNGYGVGDDFTGSVLFIDMDPADRQFLSTGCGKYMSLIDAEISDQIDDVLYSYLSQGDYYNGMIAYIDCLETLHQLRAAAPALPVEEAQTYVPAQSYDADAFSTYAPAPRFRVSVVLIAAVLVGLIAAAIRVSSLTRKMRSVKLASGARGYLVDGSFRLHTQRDIYLYSNVVRHLRQDKPSSGSRGGGGSIHVSSSSSGRSFSGSGRRF